MEKALVEWRFCTGRGKNRLHEHEICKNVKTPCSQAVRENCLSAGDMCFLISLLGVLKG